MGKYYVFKHDYINKPESAPNFRRAIILIGKKDPKRIRKTTLLGRPAKITERLTENDYFNRGILNIRKQLNSHLGMSGKYTNRMIRLSTEFEILIENGVLWIKTKLPKNEFKDIVSATYNILKKCDNPLCTELLRVEQNDEYEMNTYYTSLKFKTIAPIQTNTIIRTKIGKTEAITKFAEKFREDIIKVK